VKAVTAAFGDRDLVVDAFRVGAGDTMLETGQDAMRPMIQPLHQFQKQAQATVAATSPLIVMP